MNKLEQAARQALEALETKGEHHSRVYEAITALREALAGVNMSPTEHAVIQQALEHKRSCAYKRIDQNPSECTCGVTEALTALREALAEQEEQEPVAEVIDAAESYDGYEAVIDTGDKPLPPGTKLYAEPVRTKDLTDDEIRAMFNGYVAPEILLMFRAVIAADREKNK